MTKQTSTIPKGWKETTLGDVVEIIDGDRGLNYPKNSEFFSDGYCLFLNTKNVPNDSFSFEEKMFVDKGKDAKLRKGKLKRGDFVLTTRGTVGNFAYYSEKVPFDNIRINSGMVILRTNDEILNKSYLNFYLKSQFFHNQVFSLSSGTAQPQLPIKNLRVFQIYTLPLIEQQAIAAVLSSLDDKIELLHEQNKTLETTAQAIFKEWFVNFNFPGATGKTIDSELGKIPEGWRVGRLTDIASVLGGGTPKTDIAKYWGGDIPFFTPKDADDVYCMITEKTITNEGLNSCNSQLYPKNTVFITARGTVGKCALSSDNMAMNQSCYALIGKDISNFFIFLTTKYLVNSIQKVASGGVFDAITTATFESLKVIIPQNGIIEKFSTIASPIFGKILHNSLQIQTLSALRDALLPKLMKGEVRVKGFSD